MKNGKHKEKQKNVIWIFGDQLRGQALSCNGDSNVTTPNIDFLSSSGVNFHNAYSGFPLCCPFRGSLLTSRYPHSCVPGHEFRMPTDMRTIAHVFNDNDYNTAYFGKWHLDGFKEVNGRAAFHFIPPERRGGFKYWLGYENNNSQWDSWVHESKLQEEQTFQRLEGYETDAITNLMLNHLDETDKETPFFYALSVQPSHDPYVAPAEYMGKHNPQQITLRDNVPSVPWVEKKTRNDLAGYYSMIENLDYNVGRIIKRLRELDLYEDTFIIFFSDHGDMHGSHGQFRKTIPYEEATRIPFIISGGPSCYYTYYNGYLYEDTEMLLNHVDIAPTTLGLCGIKKPDWMDGEDLSCEKIKTEKEKPSQDSVFLQSVVASGHGDSIDKPWRGVVTKDGWKYVCLENIDWLMFDLKSDPYERVNLAHNVAFGETRSRLRKQVSEWVDKTGDTFSVPQP